MLGVAGSWGLSLGTPTGSAQWLCAQPLQGQNRQCPGAPCADPQTDTSVHVSHATPQRHRDLGDRRDPRGQQREHCQEPGVCKWGQKGNQGTSPELVPRPRKCGPSGCHPGHFHLCGWQTCPVCSNPCPGPPLGRGPAPHPTPRDHRVDGTGDPVPRDRVTGPAQRRH